MTELYHYIYINNRRPFKLSPCATLVYELANAKKRPLNLLACATLVHELANAKKCPPELVDVCHFGP